MDTHIKLSPKRSVPEPHFSCSTCRDEGLPAQVLHVDAATQLAIVATERGESEVALDLLDNVQIGDLLLVHLGTAIAKLDTASIVAGAEVAP